MRAYILTDKEREKLRAWLESGAEEKSTQKLFHLIKKNIAQIWDDFKLMMRVARKLRVVKRWRGRIRLG